MTCAACGSGALEPYLKVAGVMGPDGLIPTTERYGTALADIVRCAECGHGQLERMPPVTGLAEAYGEAASEAYVDEEAGQRATARAVLERVEAARAPGRLLDLGCWVGFLLAEARGRGWETLGVEPSAFAAACARDVLGLEVVEAGIEDVELEAEGFDAVVLGDVIEHLPDPGAALDSIAAVLRPGGVVALMVPDAGSRLARRMGARWWSVLPTHVHYFTRHSLFTLLRRHGFEPVIAETQPKAFTVRYYFDRIGGYSRPLSRALVGAASAAGVADRLWAPDFRDRMLVIARRV